MAGNIIIPEVTQQDEIRRLVESLYQQWRIAHEKAQPQFYAVNIRFSSDSQWRSRFWSIQAAADRKQIAWKVVNALFWTAQTVTVTWSLWALL